MSPSLVPPASVARELDLMQQLSFAESHRQAALADGDHELVFEATAAVVEIELRIAELRKATP